MKSIALGVERFLEEPPTSCRGRRLGLLTNPSGVDHTLRSVVNRMASHPDLTVTALYGPEHGVRGAAQAGEHVGTSVDDITGLPVYSLYGETREPDASMLEPIDAMVIDLQDIGVRYATYLSSVALVMDACARHGKDVILLDRPNPLGGARVAGNILDPAFRSFVGTHTMPVVHGLTLGEFGRLWARDTGVPAPEVITMGGWTRDLWFDDTDMPWVLPSPNLPTLDAVTLYPATCLIEGTVLSEGRGTTRPFEFVGAPWVNPDHLADALRDLQLEGVLFRPVSFSPCFSKHQGAVCGGVQLYITDRDRVDWLRVGVLTLTTIKRLYPDDFAWITPTGERYFIDLLAGTADLRQAIDGDNPAAIEDLLARWTDEARAFRASRADVLLYP